MEITVEEVRRIAALAHLDLDRATEDRLLSSLDQILEYARILDRLDTRDVPPAGGPGGPPPILRNDEEAEGLGAEAALANAPEAGLGHFKVPRVLPG